MTALRDTAIEAAAAALLSHEWTPGDSYSAHGRHVYESRCAVCLGDLARVVPVVLDAADAAVAAVADDPQPSEASS